MLVGAACALLQGHVPEVRAASDLKAFALDAATKHAPIFREALELHNFTHFKRGALPQEILMLASVVRELKADVVVESGRARGDSGLMLLAALHQLRKRLGGKPVAFHSLDWSGSRSFVPADDKVARQRLSQFPNVTVWDGNALTMLPHVLGTLKSSRVVLFTDGPKGYAGMYLNRQANQMRHVVAQFVHDAGFGFDVRAQLDNLITGTAGDLGRRNWPCATEAFSNDDPDFADRFAYLDELAGVPVSQPPYQDHASRKKPCCLYAPPAPCYGNVTRAYAITLVMRRSMDPDERRACMAKPLPPARCELFKYSPACADWKCRPLYKQETKK